MICFIQDWYDEFYRKRYRINEFKKYKDQRRIDIYSQVSLTQEQMKEIDDLYIENYGEKIPYTWHRHFTAFTGQFDKNYIPELLFIPEFEWFMDYKLEYTKVFSDKNILPMLAKNANVDMPKTIYSCTSGILQNAQHSIVSISDISDLSGEFFMKPTVDSCSGQGCQVLKLENGVDSITGKTIMDIINSSGLDWVIQERLRCHHSISDIYPDSVNTFRIMTYVWKDQICHVPAIMRIGQGGSNVDNAHAGGMFIAIDDDGTLHEKAFTEFKNEFTEHPDTHLKYNGYQIMLFPEVLKAAKRCHSLIPQIGCINWDFTIDDNGNPILIEANIRGGSIWLFQMAHGRGIFGDKTPEILKWLRMMKHMKKSEWLKHAYGKTNMK